MVIRTTMVRFRFPKEAMKKQTDKAQLFVCGEKEKVWVPLVKLSVKDDEDNPAIFNECVMPKWVYMKSVLPFYTDCEEFVVTTTIEEKQLERYGSFISDDSCEALSDNKDMKLVVRKTINQNQGVAQNDYYTAELYFKEDGSWIRANNTITYSRLKDFVDALKGTEDFKEAYKVLSEEINDIEC